MDKNTPALQRSAELSLDKHPQTTHTCLPSASVTLKDADVIKAKSVLFHCVFGTLVP